MPVGVADAETGTVNPSLGDEGKISPTANTGQAGGTMNFPNNPAEAPKDEYVLKLVMIGDSGVGKTSLVLRYTQNRHPPQGSTAAFEFATKEVKFRGGQRVRAQIWDTAGQEKHSKLGKLYYRGAVGVLICYDLTNRQSFDNVAQWLAEIREHAHEKIVILLVGNKMDLVAEQGSRKTSMFEALRFAKQNGIQDVVEMSALDSTNVDEGFRKIITKVAEFLPFTATGLPKLPDGWTRVSSRSRYGEYSYKNKYTSERVAWPPTEPAKPLPLIGNVPIEVTIRKEDLEPNNQRKSKGQCSYGRICCAVS